MRSIWHRLHLAEKLLYVHPCLVCADGHQRRTVDGSRHGAGGPRALKARAERRSRLLLCRRGLAEAPGSRGRRKSCLLRLAMAAFNFFIFWADAFFRQVRPEAVQVPASQAVAAPSVGHGVHQQPAEIAQSPSRRWSWRCWRYWLCTPLCSRSSGWGESVCEVKRLCVIGQRGHCN